MRDLRTTAVLNEIRDRPSGSAHIKRILLWGVALTLGAIARNQSLVTILAMASSAPARGFGVLVMGQGSHGKPSRRQR